MKRVLAIIAFVGFFLSLMVHLTTFLGIDPSKRAPFVWGLHVGIFIVFIPMLIYQRSEPKGYNFGAFMASMPNLARYAIVGLFVYAVLNFALFFLLSEGGVPHERDGKYVLDNHGAVIRELSEEEYELQKAYIVRGFSGHWMVFYLVPALLLWPRREEDLIVSQNHARWR